MSTMNSLGGWHGDGQHWTNGLLVACILFTMLADWKIVIHRKTHTSTNFVYTCSFARRLTHNLVVGNSLIENMLCCTHRQWTGNWKIFGWGALKIPSYIQWKAGHAITKNRPKSLDSTQSSPRIGYEFFFFGSRPLESNAMGYLGWSRKACRILVLYKKKKKLKKLKAQYTKRKARNKYFIMTSAKKIVTQTRETQMKNKAIRQKKISMPRWLFPSF